MRADRLLSIIMLLQTRGKMTAQALAEELEVSRRTILRDIDALSFAGVPLYTDSGHGGGIALDEAYSTTLTGLDASEVRTLFIASHTHLLNDIGLGNAAESTLLKLSASLPVAHQPTVDHIRQRILIDPAWWWHDPDTVPFWDDLQQAVYEDRCIQVIYERYNGTVVERVLEPYSLVAKSSLWYLVARRDSQLRTYRVSRLLNMTLLDNHFQRDPEFDLRAYWEAHMQSFVENMAEYEFTLKVHPDRINFAMWLAPGRSQIVETAGDNGWVTVRFHFESIDLAKMLVFGLGRQALVVEPPELHAAVLENARELLDPPYEG